MKGSNAADSDSDSGEWNPIIRAYYKAHVCSLFLATEPESDDDLLLSTVKSPVSPSNTGEASGPVIGGLSQGDVLGLAAYYKQHKIPYPSSFSVHHSPQIDDDPTSAVGATLAHGPDTPIPLIPDGALPATSSVATSSNPFHLTPIPVGEPGCAANERLRSLLCRPNYANGLSWEQLPILSKFRPTLAHKIRQHDTAEFKDEEDRRAVQDFCQRIRRNAAKDPEAYTPTARHAASSETLHLLSRITATCVRITRVAVALRLEDQRLELEHLEALTSAVAAMADIETKARLELGIEEGTFGEYDWP